MGGKNETVICGLRFHENNGNVHIHDDAKQFKYEAPVEEFKEDVQDAFDTLMEKEGIVKITGMKDDFYIMKQGRNISVFLMGNDSIKKKLQSFIRNF